MAYEDVEWYRLGHVGSVEFGEAKGCLAQLAVFLLGMGQPFHQAVLMDIFDASAAFARIEEGFVCGAISPTYSTGVGIA